MPYFVENYKRKVKLLEEVPHDGVPFAHASTGTYIFAKAFGADGAVRRFGRMLKPMGVMMRPFIFWHGLRRRILND